MLYSMKLVNMIIKKIYVLSINMNRSLSLSKIVVVSIISTYFAIPYWLLWMELFTWQGPFYILNLENSRWLSYYSQVFDFVEVDSSFYRTPNAFMVKNWCKKNPDWGSILVDYHKKTRS